MSKSAAVCIAIVWCLVVSGPTASVADTVTIPTGSDTSVWSHAPNNNWGVTQVSPVGRNVGKSATFRSLLHFNLSTVPANALINSATLRLFIDQATADPPNLALTAQRLQQSFVEGNNSTGVTWNTQPAVFASPTDTATMDILVGGWFAMDLQALVETARASASPNDLWLRLAATDENPASGTAYFGYRTKEHGSGTQRAELVIDYTLAPADSATIDLVVIAPTAGSIAYNGSGGPLVGSNVAVDVVVGLDTPLQTGQTRTCFACVLSFATGNLTATDATSWSFGAGGSVTLTGGIDLDNNGSLGSGDIPLGTSS